MVGIVYFSGVGSTKNLAEILGEKLGGKLVRLEEEKKRGFMSNGFRAASKKSSKLVGDPASEIGDMDELYLLTPIWAGNGTPAMNAFLNEADLQGKEVTIMTVMAAPDLSGVGSCHDYLSDKATSKGAKVKKCIAFHGASIKQIAPKEYMASQLEKHNL